MISYESRVWVGPIIPSGSSRQQIPWHDLQNVSSFAGMVLRNTIERDTQCNGKAERHDEKENHDSEAAAAAKQVRKETPHHVVLQIKDQHMDEVKTIANFTEKLQHWTVHEWLPPRCSNQQRQHDNARKEEIQCCFPERSP